MNTSFLYSISWANKLFGFPDQCEDRCGSLEIARPVVLRQIPSAKRNFSMKKVSKKCKKCKTVHKQHINGLSLLTENFHRSPKRTLELGPKNRFCFYLASFKGLNSLFRLEQPNISTHVEYVAYIALLASQWRLHRPKTDCYFK